METVPINIDIPKGTRLPGDLCHRLAIMDNYIEIPPNNIRLLGYREITQSIDEVGAMIKRAVPDIGVTVSDETVVCFSVCS